MCPEFEKIGSIISTWRPRTYSIRRFNDRVWGHLFTRILVHERLDRIPQIFQLVSDRRQNVLKSWDKSEQCPNIRAQLDDQRSAYLAWACWCCWRGPSYRCKPGPSHSVLQRLKSIGHCSSRRPDADHKSENGFLKAQNSILSSKGFSGPINRLTWASSLTVSFFPTDSGPTSVAHRNELSAEVKLRKHFSVVGVMANGELRSGNWDIG